MRHFWNVLYAGTLNENLLCMRTVIVRNRGLPIEELRLSLLTDGYCTISPGIESDLFLGAAALM